MAVDDPSWAGGAVEVPLREAKAGFSDLVARADLLGQVTVLTKHGRPAAALVPAPAAQAPAMLAELWQLLDRVCPPGTNPGVDEVRARQLHRSSPAVPLAGDPRR